MENQGFQVIEADLSTEKGVNNLVSKIDSLEFDILINNAGQSVDHDFRVKIPNPLSADRCIYADLQAPIKLITSLVPRLSERPEAAIVNVTSGLAIAQGLLARYIALQKLDYGVTPWRYASSWKRQTLM